MSGVVGSSQNVVGAGMFPDITPSLRHFALKCVVVTAGGGDDFPTATGGPLNAYMEPSNHSPLFHTQNGQEPSDFHPNLGLRNHWNLAIFHPDFDLRQ